MTGRCGHPDEAPQRIREVKSGCAYNLRRIGAALILGMGVLTGAEATAEKLRKFPQEIDKSCNYGRAKLYDACGSQIAHFDEALRAANQAGKTLLVVYGAEWCIWCHVLHRHLTGAHSLMFYRYGAPDEKTYDDVLRFERAATDPTKHARDLRDFAADTFVVAHIEGNFSPDGGDVLHRAGAMAHFSGGIPFVFTVTAQGQYAAHLPSDRVETSRENDDWYRGYDRKALMQELTRMQRAAQ